MGYPPIPTHAGPSLNIHVKPDSPSRAQSPDCYNDALAAVMSLMTKSERIAPATQLRPLPAASLAHPAAYPQRSFAKIYRNSRAEVSVV
jgi:hypothetical protein